MNRSLWVGLAIAPILLLACLCMYRSDMHHQELRVRQAVDQGAAARAAGLPYTANPYTAWGLNAEWLQGYSQGTPPKTPPEDEYVSRLKRQGASAAAAGLPHTANPYSDKWSSHPEIWLEGYTDYKARAVK